jgi:hypothetical protein
MKKEVTAIVNGKLCKLMFRYSARPRGKYIHAKKAKCLVWWEPIEE